MDTVSYRGLEMRVVQSLPHARTVELDESRNSYKWTRWDLSFIVTLEPLALSANLVSPPYNNLNVAPLTANAANYQNKTSVKPTMPGVTDTLIRRFLEYPRGQLIVTASGPPLAADGTPQPIKNFTTNASVVVLRSPAAGMECDANSGPFCKVNSIQEVAGERMWLLHLTFTTYIYEDSLDSITGTPPILISNRWAVTTDTNESHLTDRIVEGIVHFRNDQLLAAETGNGESITDFYRSVFASFTVPSGFQRKKVQCTTLAQGNMVRYRIVDREQPLQQVNIGNADKVPSIRLEYTERSWMWRGSAARAVGQGLDAPARVPAWAEPFLPLFGAGGVAAFNLLIRGANVLHSGAKQLPKRYKTVIVRAWGNRLFDRAAIVGRAVQLLVGRMGTASLLLPHTAEMSISYHSAQMMAQAEQTFEWSFSDAPTVSITTALNLTNLLFNNPDRRGVGDLLFDGYAGQNADVTGMLQRSPNFTQPPFPSQSGTHGTWPRFSPAYLADLATQTLESIGASPDAPP